MKKKFLVAAMIVGITALFISTGCYAGTKAEDVIKLEEPSYPHKKGIIEFTHAKHVKEYKAACGDCHHDKEGKPLELKEGDNVQRCVECHSKPGEIKKKDAKAQGLSDKQKREYHANALHDNCIGCHKKYNDEKNPPKDKKAPTSCTKCHPKKAK